MHNQHQLVKILQLVVPLGVQETLDNIPLPQFQVQDKDGHRYIIIYSSLDDSGYHCSIVRNVIRNLKVWKIKTRLVKKGIAYAIDHPSVRFFGTRLQVF